MCVLMWIVDSTDAGEPEDTQNEQESIENGPTTGGVFDHIPIISESSLARKLAWKSEVKRAVKDETEHFWEKVVIQLIVKNLQAIK